MLDGGCMWQLVLIVRQVRSLVWPVDLLDHFLGCLCVLGTMQLSGCWLASSQATGAYFGKMSGRVAGPVGVEGLLLM